MNTKESTNYKKMYSPMNNMEFSNWLQSEMDKREWNNSDIARNAGVTRGAIGNILRGDRGPGIDLCKAIAKALALPADVVLQKAGLLPPDQAHDEYMVRLEYLFNQLTEKEKRAVLNYVKFMIDDPDRSTAR